MSAAIGLGVFATRPIPRGTLVWVACPRERFYTPAAVVALSAAERDVLEHHGYVGPDGHTVLCCDLARYLNHSCRPAALPLGPDADIAVRDLAAGDEITCEYSALNVAPLGCRCGEPECRGIVRGEDLTREEHWRAWDRLVEEAVRRPRAVAQPLLARAGPRARLEAILAGACPIPSVRSCLHREAGAAPADEPPAAPVPPPPGQE